MPSTSRSAILIFSTCESKCSFFSSLLEVAPKAKNQPVPISQSKSFRASIVGPSKDRSSTVVSEREAQDMFRASTPALFDFPHSSDVPEHLALHERRFSTALPSKQFPSKPPPPRPDRPDRPRPVVGGTLPTRNPSNRGLPSGAPPSPKKDWEFQDQETLIETVRDSTEFGTRVTYRPKEGSFHISTLKVPSCLPPPNQRGLFNEVSLEDLPSFTASPAPVPPTTQDTQQ